MKNEYSVTTLTVYSHRASITAILQVNKKMLFQHATSMIFRDHIGCVCVGGGEGGVMCHINV